MRKASGLAAAIMLMATALHAPAAGQISAASHSMSIADLVAWRTLVPLRPELAPGSEALTLPSPDGSTFLVRVRSVDKASNQILDELLQFNIRDVEQALKARSPVPPRPRTVLVTRSKTLDGAISQVRWSDLETITFLAADALGRRQIFSASLGTGRQRQETRSPNDISSYALRKNGYFYYAYAPLPAEGAEKLVTGRLLGEVLFPRDHRNAPSQLFVVEKGRVRRLDAPDLQLFEYHQMFWPSPSGRYAVILLPAWNATREWARYQMPDYPRFGYSPDKLRSDPTSMDLLGRTQYGLIDVRTREVRPLLNAPTAGVVNNGTPVGVFWPDDEKSVLLTNTFLPLDGTDAAEQARRSKYPAIVQVDLSDDRATPVFWEAALSDLETAQGKILSHRILSFEWDGRDSQLTIRLRHRLSRNDNFIYERVLARPAANTWTTSTSLDPPKSGGVDVALAEDLSNRPRLVASLDGASLEILDPNPQAESFRFGKASVFRWSDPASKIAWKAGLVLPTDFEVGKRYPLIVQTHGFDESKFLLSGPDGGLTAFGAQVYANQGFVVLQVEDNVQAFTDDEQEGPLFADGIKAAIDKLVEQGLIDRDNVGLISWSRTGLHAINILARHPKLLRAVSICDSVQPAYLQTAILNYGQSAEATLAARRLAGVDGDVLADPGRWLPEYPLFKARNSIAAVRLEADSGGSDGAGAAILGLWETYVVLSSAGRPVDFVAYPKGSHVQALPEERRLSVEGNLDWFRYWLQDFKDPDPSKTAQYLRWDRLRETPRYQ
jgi:dipeptidyl aminopeptidase/acylaminoacyl peptidase